MLEICTKRPIIEKMEMGMQKAACKFADMKWVKY